MIVLLISAGFSTLFSLGLTPLFIRLIERLRWGQFIRADGPESHLSKRGTPTMGGIVFILGSVFSYLLAKWIRHEDVTASAMLVLMLMVGLGLVGFLDDYLKTRKQQSLGLSGWGKIAGQVCVALAFAVCSLLFADEQGTTPASTRVSVMRDTGFDWLWFGPIVGLGLFCLWIILLVTATSNAVNLTDGLDGLATGAAILAISGYIFIGLWQFNQSCLNPVNMASNCYTVRDPLDLAVIAATIVGGLVGFLWWNTNPARLYMGDTGSLGIGGALVALAILTHTELLLILIGGLFVMETGSVILQRIYFKLTKGQRIFLMSPIHHHFELKGWLETTVVVRFWLIAGFFVLLGVGLFYAEWLGMNR